MAPRQRPSPTTRSIVEKQKDVGIKSGMDYYFSFKDAAEEKKSLQTLITIIEYF
jgi:hypothetical protein